ncbi:MAG: chloride channel protein [Mycoplasmatales bacterium]
MNRFKELLKLIIIGIAIGIAMYILGISFIFIFNKLIFNLFPFNLILFPVIAIGILYIQTKFPEVNFNLFNIYKEANEGRQISIFILPFQYLSTVLSHFSGASTGRSGAAMQMGSSISDNLSRLIKINTNQKEIVAAGQAAGFGALFGTPFAAIFLIFTFTRRSITDYIFWYYTIVITLVASFVTTLLKLPQFKYHLEMNILDYNIEDIITVVVIAIIFLIIGNLYVYSLINFRKKVNSLFTNNYIKVILLSLIAVFFLYILNNGAYMSYGANLLNDAFFKPTSLNSLDFLMKGIVTILVLSCGMQGGEITPLYIIGATLGATLALIFGLPTALLAALGYVLVFTNATNAYIAGIFLGVEVFGFAILPPLLICIVITYLLDIDTNIYTS